MVTFGGHVSGERGYKCPARLRINVTYDFNSVRFFSGSYTFGINMSVQDILVIGVYVGLDRWRTGGERIHAERTGVYSPFFCTDRAGLLTWRAGGFIQHFLHCIIRIQICTK